MKLKRYRHLTGGDEPVACVWCNLLLDKNTATAEHMLPKAFGGNSEKHNMRVACQDCYSERGAVTNLILIRD